MVDLEIKQGATFRVTFAYQNPDGTPISLAGLSARMQARPSHSSDELILDLTVGSGLTLDAAAGEVHVEVPATTTATLTQAGQLRIGVFDVELFDSVTGEVTRLVEGRIRVTPEVTR